MSSKNLFITVSKPTQPTSRKVTVVGIGAVGMATALSLLCQGISNDVCLIDVVGDRLKGEKMDILHGSLFLKNPKISASKGCEIKSHKLPRTRTLKMSYTAPASGLQQLLLGLYAPPDFSASAGSKVCIITAGVRQQEGESRLNLVQRNADIMKITVPSLLQYSPDTILLIVSNPCDILTYVAWKISKLPLNRVVGAGTNLDSARFRFLLAQRLGVSTSSVHGWIIGEHGDTSVPVWSDVNVAGVRLKEISPKLGGDDDQENWKKVHKEVIDAAYQIIKMKGYTNWAIGLSAASIANTILTNQHNVHAVSVMVKGRHGLDYEVFLSLPAVVGANGVEKVVMQNLAPNEKCALKFSAALMAEVQVGIKF